MLPLDTLANLFARSRVLRVSLAVLVVAVTVIAALGLRRLEFDDVPRNVFDTNTADQEVLDEMFDQFGSDDHDCLLVVESVSGKDLFTPAATRAVRQLARRLAELEGIETVDSLDSPMPFTGSLLPAEDADAQQREKARSTALAYPLVTGRMLSPDARTTVIVARIDHAIDKVDDIQPIVARIKDVAEQAGDGPLRVRLTGVAPLRVDIYDAVRRETVKFTVIGAGLAFLVATLLFRRLVPTLIVGGAATLGAVWTLGAMGWVGEKLNLINVALPTLIIVVGLTDAVHLMIDIRRSLAQGAKPLVAAQDAIRHLGLACSMTSFTTAVGFGSLVVAEADIIKHFGLACAAGAMFMLICVLTVVPLVSSTWLGNYLAPRFRETRFPGLAQRAESLIGWIADHARLVTAAGAVVTGLLAISATRLVPDSLITETIPPKSDSFLALKHIDEVMGGSLQTFVLVEWDEPRTMESPELLDTLQEVHRVLIANPQTHEPASILSIVDWLPGRLPLTRGYAAKLVAGVAAADESVVRTTARLFARLSGAGDGSLDLAGQWGTLRRLVRPDLRRAMVVAQVKDVGTATLAEAFDDLRAKLADIESRREGIRLTLTGTVAVAARSIDQMVWDLATSLALATVVIFVAMTAAFQSVRYGLISVVPNIFPLVATAAVMVALGDPLQLNTMIVFTICLGIAVDDTIHFLNRFKREMRVDGNTTASIRRAFLAVGRALMVSTLILLAGFGSVLASELPSSQVFARLSCFAIGSALLGDLVILPALLATFVRGQRTDQATDTPAVPQHVPPDSR